MVKLIVDVERDLRQGILVIRPTGSLTLDAARHLREIATNCLVEVPVAVVLDLSRLSDVEAGAHLVFRELAERAATEPAVRLVCCSPDERLAALLAPLDHAFTVCKDETEARTVVDLVAVATPWVHGQYPSTVETPSLARLLVGDACLRWGLNHLMHRARLVVSELVSNAVHHAGGDIDVTATVREPYLVVTVRDRSPVPPRRLPPPRGGSIDDHGRGLLIVAAHATSWGYVPAGTGKAVWARLATEP